MKKQIILVAFFIAMNSFAQEKKYTTYRVTDHETISSISKKIGITPYDLLKLNPDAKDGINIDEVLIIPNKNYKALVVKPTQTNVTFQIQKPLIVKDSIRNGYLYHTVKPYETIYSLSRKYKISKRKAKKLNKLNRSGDIAVNQVLRFPTDLKDTPKTPKTPIIPVIKEELETTTKKVNFMSYTVQPKDTFYTLTRLYKVTKEKLIELNPQLKAGLKLGDQILIPIKSEEIIETIQIIEQPTYKTHIVVAKEGFFRLKQIYGVTEEELITENPELKDGLKVGMKIRIPIKQEEKLMLEGDIQGKVLNVAMMLPFKAGNMPSFKKSKFLNNVTDFYLGSLIALEDLKAKGLSVNVKVFDTKNNASVVSNIFATEDFSKTDVIIGPLVYSRFKEATAFLKNEKTSLISPLAKKDHSLIFADNIIQNTATDLYAANKMLDLIKAKYNNQNLIIVTDEISPESNLKIAKIELYLKKHDSIKNITVLRMKDGYIEKELFDESMKEDKENWVILASNTKSTISVAINNLGVYPKEFDVTLFALKKPKNTEILKNHFLNRLSFYYPSVNFIDKTNIDVLTFNQKYQAKNSLLPSHFSYKGYDTMYDILIRLANYEGISNVFQAGKTKRLSSKFNYIQSASKGYFNDGVFIVKYDDFELKEVE